jgi:phosphatidylglycerol:prolipoprotein diacylglycerol transferase
MFPTLQIGRLAIQTPGLILLVSLWLGLTFTERFVSRQHISPDDIYNLSFTALIAGVVGARLTYVARYPNAFLDSPLSLISLNPELLDPWGGLTFSLLAALIYGQRKKLSLWPTLDTLTPALAVLAIGFGLAHLASGSAFGKATDLPWGIQLWGTSRHPSQVYETLAALVILSLVWPRKGQPTRPSGVQFLTFTALSAGARLFLESFRGDSTLILGGFRASQIIAWLILVCALILLDRKFQKPDLLNPATPNHERSSLA